MTGSGKTRFPLTGIVLHTTAKDRELGSVCGGWAWRGQGSWFFRASVIYTGIPRSRASDDLSFRLYLPGRAIR